MNGEMVENLPGSQIVWTQPQAPIVCLCCIDWIMHIITEKILIVFYISDVHWETSVL